MTHNAQKILIVDDNDIDALIGTKLFKSFDDSTKVFNFQSPQEALNFLRIGDDLPDLILVDLYMPQMNGLEFVQNLVKLGLDNIPIIMISCTLQEGDIQASLRLPGVTQFLSKPMTRDKVAHIRENYQQIA